MEKQGILLIAMPSTHFFKWASHIDLDKFELYWYNILNMDYEKDNVLFFKKVYNTYEKRKIGNIKGEYFLSKKSPRLYNLLRPYLEVTENEIVENIIDETQPEIIHTFEMQSCTYPIIDFLISKPNIKWIYSCWGSDLFYFQNLKKHRRLIKKALKRINFIHTDNLRDQNIANKLNFKGIFTEVIPGGGGYDVKFVSKYFQPLDKRKFILIKGYEHKMGRSINVVKALNLLKEKGFEFDVVIFGAYPKVVEYLDSIYFNSKVYMIGEIDYKEVMKLMGQSIIYIGNSISDGMPNTLIEAFLMGAFPIQSNPGGATAEIIDHRVNGCLINDPENIGEIETLVQWVLENKTHCKNQVLQNHIYAKAKFSFENTQIKINTLYENVIAN